MPRPKKCRLVNAPPGVRIFKPQGIPARTLEEVYLPFEGYEALRLSDLEGLLHNEAAARMQVSRQTFGRILSDARRTVTEAIIRGLVLRIEGGDYRMENDPHGCCGHPRPGRLDAAVEKKGDSTMRKIAVSSESRELDGPVDPRFGRAAGFIVVDPETTDFEYVDNADCQGMAQGAGIQAAELMARHGVGVVLTGYVGPKAFQALAAAGIRVGQNLENVSVREAIMKYKNGEVTLAQGPNRAAGSAA
jgi:predicted DNA-binding protein (UPF0251 family)/predicted Fe-Mo cluster-binding NifX family protein